MLLEEQPGQSSLYVYVYVYEPGSYAPLARIDQREGEAENTLYCFHTDQIGTPLEMTDTDGQIVWQATYKSRHLHYAMKNDPALRAHLEGNIPVSRPTSRRQLEVPSEANLPLEIPGIIMTR